MESSTSNCSSFSLPLFTVTCGGLAYVVMTSFDRTSISNSWSLSWFPPAEITDRIFGKDPARNMTTTFVRGAVPEREPKIWIEAYTVTVNATREIIFMNPCQNVLPMGMSNSLHAILNKCSGIAVAPLSVKKRSKRPPLSWCSLMPWNNLILSNWYFSENDEKHL